MAGFSRRAFLGRAAGTFAAGGLAGALPGWVCGQSQPAGTGACAAQPKAALTHGDNRGDNITTALRLIEADIRKGLAGKKRVVIKPNLVVPSKSLSATHPDCVAAILDFLKPLFKGEIVIAESPAGSRAMPGFEVSGLMALAEKCRVRLVDIDVEPADVHYISDARYRPQPVRVSRHVTDPDTYVISSAVMKTHDRAVTTLSLKNVAIGGLKKDPGSVWGRPETGANDKVTSHGGPKNEAIHYNLFTLAKVARPHLSIIDGFLGMEGNGPANGTAVDHKIALASTDWLAADRVGVELMGFDFAKVGYLSFCARAGLGQADLKKIELLGEPLARHIRKYRPHDTIEQQYKWMGS